MKKFVSLRGRSYSEVLGKIKWEGGLGWGTDVDPSLIHVNAWQKPLQYCKLISLQLIKINPKKKKKSNGDQPVLEEGPFTGTVI